MPRTLQHGRRMMESGGDYFVEGYRRDCYPLPVAPAFYIFSQSGFTGPFPTHASVLECLADSDPLSSGEKVIEVTLGDWERVRRATNIICNK